MSDQELSTQEQMMFKVFKINLDIQHMSQSFEKNFGLSLAQWCVLRRLRDLPAVSAQGLAKATGIHPSSLTPSIKILVGKGFVFMMKDPQDTRKKIISITRNGNIAIQKVMASMRSQNASSQLFDSLKAELIMPTCE